MLLLVLGSQTLVRIEGHGSTATCASGRCPAWQTSLCLEAAAGLLGEGEAGRPQHPCNARAPVLRQAAAPQLLGASMVVLLFTSR
jgi:hypothetical protein